MWAAWCRQCHAYMPSASSIGTLPHCGCVNAFAKSASGNERRNAIHRRCSASSSASETSTGHVFTSGSSAHNCSSYVLMVGASSVAASFIRMYAFMWLSGTWCTTWRTVHPPGRYGVSSAASDNPLTSDRIRAGNCSIVAMYCSRVARSSGVVGRHIFPIGYLSFSSGSTTSPIEFPPQAVQRAPQRNPYATSFVHHAANPFDRWTAHHHAISCATTGTRRRRRRYTINRPRARSRDRRAHERHAETRRLLPDLLGRAHGIAVSGNPAARYRVSALDRP